MRGFVGNTDFDSFTFLAARQPLGEVNFWQPSGGDAFRALQSGEPFFFRLKKPHYAIGGFGLCTRRGTRSHRPGDGCWNGSRHGVSSLARDFAEACARRRVRWPVPTSPTRRATCSRRSRR